LIIFGPGGIGPGELLIIFAIILLLFGGSRLANIGGSLGKSIKEFRQALKEEEQPAPSDSGAKTQNGPAQARSESVAPQGDAAKPK
jgi:sec-independent protein translocase protein TatA